MSGTVLTREIAREQAGVSRAYAELDRARERAAADLQHAYTGPTTGTDQAATERESFARTYAGRAGQLNAVERGLCFGRVDTDTEESFLIGRLGLFDDDHDVVLVDWRAPVAQPFYRATATHPCGIRRRRHIRLKGRRVVGVDDDLLDVPAEDRSAIAVRETLTGEAALFASLTANRTGRMSEIVSTIQGEQDAIIRAGLPGVLVVTGGPGTGKTVVALHRAAYLLYTHREHLSRRGVLVVGPNPTFLHYIDQVLPSLGETDVVLSTVGSLFPGVVATGTESVTAARVKGRLEMADVIARAVRHVRRERSVRAGSGRDLTAERLLTLLWSSPERLAAAAPGLSETERLALWREPGARWTPADVALLDEAAELLGETDASIRQRRRAQAERAAEDAEHAAFTRDTIEIRLAADGLTLEPWEVNDFIELMAERTRHRDDPGTVAERAAADRSWQFGHVIVDEAQELSPMDWRMLMRRCGRRSMTLVGDLAQAGSDAGVHAWPELLDRYAQGRWRIAELSVNYRTPAEIMTLAADVLARIDPQVTPPSSVRFTGEAPWGRCVPTDRFVAAVIDAVVAERDRVGDGRLAVLVPPTRAEELTAALTAAIPETASRADPAILDATVAVLEVDRSKGLEFDSVIIADPAAILRDSPRGLSDLYVAVTRATRRLGVIADGDLPEPLSRLTEPPEPGFQRARPTGSATTTRLLS